MSVSEDTFHPPEYVEYPSLRIVGAIFWIEYIPHDRYRIYNRLLICYLDNYATLESHYDVYMGQSIGRNVDTRTQ